MGQILTFIYCKISSLVTVLCGRSVAGRKWKYTAKQSDCLSEKKVLPHPWWRFSKVLSAQLGIWLILKEMMSYCVFTVALCSGHVHAQDQPWAGKVCFTELMHNLHPSQQSPFICKLSGWGLHVKQRAREIGCLISTQCIVLYIWI